MVFVNKSELPWDFWFIPNRCDSYGHRQDSQEALHLVIRRPISLVSEQARMGRMLRDEHL